MWETTPTMCLDQGAQLGSCPHPPPSLPPPQVESNFASYHKFLMQALIYLSSPYRHLKLAAMKFIGRLWPRGLARPPPHCPLPRAAALDCRVPVPWGLLQQGQWAGPRVGTIGPSSQALVSCHSSPSCCAGGILQDYFSNLCFSLKTDDVKILRKREHRAHLDLPSAPTCCCPPRPPAPAPLPCPAGVAVWSDPWVCAAEFEVLKQEQDSICRKFYQDHLDNVIELFQNVAH